MKIVTYVLALVLIDGFMTWVNGADDFTVGVSPSCHNDDGNFQLIVQYTGTGNPTAIKWEFSKMINPVATLDVVINFCAATAGADIAFPEDRMTFFCDTTNNQYNISISNFNETADAGEWKAALSVSGSFTDFQSVTVSKCSSIPTTENLTSTMTTNATSTTKFSTVVTTTKPTTTTSSSNETTVIIVSSVLGGLFLIGIVITFVLMLLSQRRGHHQTRNHRHRDQDQRHKRRDNHRYPSWQDNGHYNNASYMEYTGMGSKMNPLYTVPYRSAHRADQNYYHGYPSTDHQSYTRNHQIYYGGYSSNMRLQTNMHSYEQRYYGQRGGNTLPRDENNYVAPDYELYW